MVDSQLMPPISPMVFMPCNAQWIEAGILAQGETAVSVDHGAAAFAPLDLALRFRRRSTGVDRGPEAAVMKSAVGWADRLHREAQRCVATTRWASLRSAQPTCCSIIPRKRSGPGPGKQESSVGFLRRNPLDARDLLAQGTVGFFEIVIGLQA